MLGGEVLPLQLTIHDSENGKLASLLYGSLSKADGAFTQRRSFEIAGRRWLLDVSSTLVFDREAYSGRHWLIIGVGLVVSALLAAFLHTFGRARERELALAEAATREATLREER